MKKGANLPALLTAGIKEAGVVPYAGKLLVGVSGGADSAALLHLLYAVRHELALDLVVVHYDHALRRGSGKDARFVGRMAGSLGLPFVAEKNSKTCPRGKSVEDFARQMRFDFFIRTARKLKADAVVLAHTQDDLAETVLMRILRGAGLSGLRAILPQRRISGVLFLRPMLDVTRAQVEAFLAVRNISHVEDPTNKGRDFLRNRIRHELLPYMARRFAPAVKEKLAQLALTSAADYAFIEHHLHRKMDQVLRSAPGGVKVSVKVWKGCPQAVRRMILREAAERLPGGGGLSFEHALLIEKTAMAGRSSRLSLPDGIRAVISDKFISLS